MDLYSLRSPNTITKFDADGNHVASYLTTLHTCDCPAGQRPTCRHRQMLAQLEPIRDTQWFLQWDAEVKVGLVVDLMGTPKRLLDKLTLIGRTVEDLDAAVANEPVLGTPAEQDTQPALTIATHINLPDDISSEDIAKAFGDLSGRHTIAEPAAKPLPSMTIRNPFRRRI